MYQAMSAEELARELEAAASGNDAHEVIHRAARVVGVPVDRPLQIDEFLSVCEAVAAEGALVQEFAEMIASRSLDGGATDDLPPAAGGS